jgi:hypothetical protein
LLLFAGLFAFANHANAGMPSVTISYSPALDSACALARGVPIKDEWKLELNSRKAEFESLWRSTGPGLVAMTEAITGKPFSSEPVTARLTLCDLPSQSLVGISVNMRYALQSFASPPVPMRYKVATLFHELLHPYVSSLLESGSALARDHDSEPRCVRNHLHLLALEKAVLLQRHEQELLQEVIAIDGQLPGGCYRQAWAIVNATDDDYLPYVAELAK